MIPDVSAGDRVLVFDDDGVGRRRKERNAVVIDDYPEFLLLDYGRYQSTLLKRKVFCGEARIKVVNRG
ncbi:MAG TPA: hypothetical protein GX513_12910 [Firmicutes bacterium]|nr:hypothetical protein [Bacillota bacterium]